MSWPGYDPFYQDNPAHNDQRKNFYSVGSVPTIWVDGSYDTNFPPFIPFVETRQGVPTDVTLEIGGQYDPDTGEGNVTVTAETASELPGGAVQYRILIGLTEDDVFYAGSNGINIHNHTMRQMYPSGGGTVVSFSGGLPQTAEVSTDFMLPAEYDESNCRIVAWLQEAVSKEVYQAGRVNVTDLDLPTDVTPVSNLTFELGRNYPNPFNPVTSIPVKLTESGSVELQVIDPRGRVVRTLHQGHLDAGQREISWDGTDESGSPLASGVYMARLTSAQGSLSQRMVLLK